jgi:hypothetical protein
MICGIIATSEYNLTIWGYLDLLATAYRLGRHFLSISTRRAAIAMIKLIVWVAGLTIRNINVMG